MKRLQYVFNPALRIQFTHLSLSALWNLTSVSLVYFGQPALGPTSSLLLVVMLLAFMWLLYITAQNSRWAYLGVSLLQLVISLKTIVNAFVLPVELWPSDFWRFTGVLVNILGVIGASWACYVICVRPQINHQQ